MQQRQAHIRPFPQTRKNLAVRAGWTSQIQKKTCFLQYLKEQYFFITIIIFKLYHSKVLVLINKYCYLARMHLIKSEYICNVKKKSYFKKMPTCNVLFIKESWKKCITVSTLILSSKTFFNIDNEKRFLSIKSAYQNDFWRIIWHWRLE